MSSSSDVTDIAEEDDNIVVIRRSTIAETRVNSDSSEADESDKDCQTAVKRRRKRSPRGTCLFTYRSIDI